MSAATPLPLRLYRGSLALGEPAVAALLRRRARLGKEEPERLGERRGLAGRPRPPGPLVWVHGASIGETVSVLPIIEALAQSGLAVLVTSGTRTSAEILARRLPPGALHQFVPFDVPRWIGRFLDHWQPGLALFAESEVWPNTILELDRRDVPLILVNGRLSERSARRWARLPGLAAALMRRISLCIVQTAADGDRFAELGAPHVAVAGNLKYDVPAPPADPRAVTALASLIADRAVWLAASIHPGEDEAVAAAHRSAREAIPRLLTIVAPRHPQRGGEVAATAAALGLKSARRSLGGEPSAAIDLYVADTVGELGLFYRIAPLAFMGGSLIRHGGQNPIEPAKIGCAILHGPHVQNFAEVYAALDRAGGALAVADASVLARALPDLIADPALMREMARAAAEVVERSSGALERTMRAMAPFTAAMVAAAA